ncbi:hypothetical protein SNEBB_006358 [Seison nebaliae]|nr:hypothetical protein SNEBB_006358 [Seison nebaliae]
MLIGTYVAQPVAVKVFKICWDLFLKRKTVEYMDFYVLPIFKRYDRETQYHLLKRIIGISNPYDIHHPTLETTCGLFLKWSCDPIMEHIVFILIQVIDHFNNPNNEINEENIRKLFNEVDSCGIVYGTDDSVDIRNEMRVQCGIPTTENFITKLLQLKVTSPSINPQNIISHISKLRIKVNKISRVDYLEDMTPLMSKIGIFILSMDDTEFHKAFNKHIWPKGTSIQQIMKNENDETSEKFLENRCSTIFERTF